MIRNYFLTAIAILARFSVDINIAKADSGKWAVDFECDGDKNYFRFK